MGLPVAVRFTIETDGRLPGESSLPQGLARLDGQPSDDVLLGAPTNLRIVGGCCGTDVRHVAALWGVDPR